MKVFIHTDIEGVAGVVEWDPRSSRYTDIEKFEKRRVISRLLTGEVNAAIRAAFDEGADTVYVSDNHGDCKTIDLESLDPRAELMQGMANLQPSWVPCLDESFDCVVAVGMHAMAGSKYASLPHSCWHINGDAIRLSEATMCAALAGTFGVPFVFASGDQTITAEIREKIPNCETAVVKTALSPYFARSVHPSVAQTRIYEGVRLGIANRHAIAPFVIPGPPYRVAASDRDPEVLISPPMEGDDFFKLVHDYLNTFPWNAFGCQDVANKVIDLSPYTKK
ncbi:MAG: M55 family metallopeptidase [Clostridiaceae bacterium]|nr:M55 family metallopeptidase [Clostridiaceae bacterium]